ncbi:HEPN domain-containing protein [Chryseobacterium flavum]|uniref:HEPN domain-containing protein n=1 Tax=Chryseobacterium flavum TaxID=415851 RepID=UPI0028B1D729|nr:HEPN domain-containing protein [Chryseobacterium flavum]
MNNILANHVSFLDELYSLVNDTENIAISDNDVDLVKNNVNFFTKSFTITLCAYLESFIKEISMFYIEYCNQKLNSINISHNIVKWSVNRKKDLVEINDNELKFESLKINIRKNELDEFVSGNPYRTEKFFKKLGIELNKELDYNNIKEKIITIVDKRNKIIHHNDNASDLSFSDIKKNIEIIKGYLAILNEKVISKCP